MPGFLIHPLPDNWTTFLPLPDLQLFASFAGCEKDEIAILAIKEYNNIITPVADV